MLLDLPKDVLSYILSIVVYETYVENYNRNGMLLRDNILSMTKQRSFYCRYGGCKARLSQVMRILSAIHPKIRQILMSACETGASENKNITKHVWRFREHFFYPMFPSIK